MSFAICLIASIAFFGLMANTRRADAKARHVLQANAYARQLMESQRLKAYADLKVGSSSASKVLTSETVSTRGTTKTTSTSSGTTMTGEVTVYEGPGTGVRSIVATVTWVGGKVQLESYVTQ